MLVELWRLEIDFSIIKFALRSLYEPLFYAWILKKMTWKMKKTFSSNFLLNHPISLPKQFGTSREGLWSFLGPFWHHWWSFSEMVVLTTIWIQPRTTLVQSEDNYWTFRKTAPLQKKKNSSPTRLPSEKQLALGSGWVFESESGTLERIKVSSWFLSHQKMFIHTRIYCLVFVTSYFKRLRCCRVNTSVNGKVSKH